MRASYGVLYDENNNGFLYDPKIAYIVADNLSSWSYYNFHGIINIA